MARAPIGAGLSFLKEALNTESDECIFWPFGTMQNGYGRVRDGKRVYFSHRWICIQVHGNPSDASLEASHECGNRNCVNPRHLRWDTTAGNHADKRIHGTHMQGERCWKSRLTRRDVHAIKGRLAMGDRIVSVARDFGVTRQAVSDIKRGRNWKHVV